MNKHDFNSSLYGADNILYTGEEMRKYYERKGIAAKGRISTRITIYYVSGDLFDWWQLKTLTLLFVLNSCSSVNN